MKKALLVTLGSLFFLGGIAGGIYLGFWCLITGIIDVYHAIKDGTDGLAKGITLIFIREFVAIIVAFAGIGLSFLCFNFAGKKGSTINKIGRK